MLTHYLTTASRHLRQHRVTTGLNVVCLALGLACFVLAWGVAEYWGQADRYHSKASRIYVLTKYQRDNGLTLTSTPWLLAEHLRTDFPQLESIARALYPREAALTADGKSSFAAVTYADAQFPEIFDLPFISGNSMALSQPRSAIVSRALAQRLFGTDAVLGRTMHLSGRKENMTITGVIAAIPQPSHLSTTSSSPSGLAFEAMLSMDMNAASRQIQRWDEGTYFTYAVLPKDGSLTAAAFDGQLAAFAKRNVSADQNGVLQFHAHPINEFTAISLDPLTRADQTGVSSTAMLKMLGAMVLLVACLNFANLATAQAAMRGKEVAMQKVVGAKRRQVILQYFVEGLLLTCTALFVALLGIVLGALSINPPMLALLAALFARMPGFWGMLIIVVIVVGGVASAYPALVLARIRPAHALRGGRIRNVPPFVSTLLVSVQFCSASFLLIALFVIAAQNRELGRAIWNPADDPLIVMTNDLSGSGVDQRLLKAQLLRAPGIKAVSGIQRMPWTPGGSGDPLTASAEASAAQIPANRSIVDADFFATLNIRVLAGRPLDSGHAADLANIAAWQRNDAGAAPDFNVVIDRLMVRRMGFASPAAAIDKVIYRPTSQTGSTPPQRLHIVGVVEEALLMPMSLGYPAFYLMNPEAAVFPIVRISKSQVAVALSGIDKVWATLAPEVPLKRRFADEQFQQWFQFLSVISSMLGALGAFATLIAMMGLVGMALHVTRRRTHEIGVRKTLGASAGQIIAMLLRNFSTPVVVANLVAWPLVFIVMRLYLSIFSVRTGLTPAPFLLVLGITLLVTWTAVAAQATRAARLKPATVLRYE